LGYEYRDRLRDSGDGPRLFLDVVGTGWSIPVRGVRADLSLPGEPVRVDCYAGAPGSHGACTGAESSGTGAVFAQDEVAPGEAMSIDVGIDPADLDGSVTGAEEGSGAALGARVSSMLAPRRGREPTPGRCSPPGSPRGWCSWPRPPPSGTGGAGGTPAARAAAAAGAGSPAAGAAASPGVAAAVPGAAEEAAEAADPRRR